LIRIARRLLDQIEAHARDALPGEACGLLIGARQAGATIVAAVEPTANVAADPTRRFEIDPARQIALQRALRGTAQEIVGVYHSHPNGAAEPSATDAALALDPDLLWLIVALRNGRADAPRAFALVAGGGSFANVPMVIEE